MRLASLDLLRCPACVARGVDSPYELDPTRVGGGEDGGIAGELLEAFLVCSRCRETRPLVAGVPILASDLRVHLDAHGNVYRRVPIADPRMTRFVLSQAGPGGDVVPFAEVVERYGDLLPANGDGAPRPSAYDAALADALRGADATGPALEIGCGVGRGTFVLADAVGNAMGVDRSTARVRRARNVQCTIEFHLPIRPDARVETPIDLGRLRRDAVDFAVAGPDALPFASDAFGVVVLRAGDGDGPWASASRARAEAERVLRADGLLLIERRDASGSRLEVATGTPSP